MKRQGYWTVLSLCTAEKRPCEHLVRRSPLVSQELTKNQPCQFLELPACRPVRNELPLFEPLRLWVSVVAAQVDESSEEAQPWAGAMNWAMPGHIEALFLATSMHLFLLLQLEPPYVHFLFRSSPLMLFLEQTLNLGSATSLPPRSCSWDCVLSDDIPITGLFITMTHTQTELVQEEIGSGANSPGI